MFYSIHMFLLFPLIGIVVYAASFFLPTVWLRPIAMALIFVWLLYEVFNILRLRYYSKSNYALLVPLFDVVKVICVLIGLVLRKRI
ncbi:MAG: hypothetical protein ABIF10_05290 [Candidatus Woesearchaeota archaeon]